MLSLVADTLTDLADSASRELRSALSATGEVRTEHLRRFAEMLVEAREYFQLQDGSADLRGSSYEYRMWAGDVYSRAGVGTAERASIQGGVNYHVSAVRRKRYTPDELNAHGMLPTSAKERAEERRHRQAAVLRLFEGSRRITAPEDAERALSIMLRTLHRFADDLQPKAVVREVERALEGYHTPPSSAARSSARVAARTLRGSE